MKRLMVAIITAALVLLPVGSASAAHNWQDFQSCTVGVDMHGAANVVYRGWSTFRLTSSDGEQRTWRLVPHDGYSTRWLEAWHVDGSWILAEGWPTPGKAGRFQDISASSEAYCVL